jgi:hypothetical protein
MFLFFGVTVAVVNTAVLVLRSADHLASCLTDLIPKNEEDSEDSNNNDRMHLLWPTDLPDETEFHGRCCLQPASRVGRESAGFAIRNGSDSDYKCLPFITATTIYHYRTDTGMGLAVSFLPTKL